MYKKQVALFSQSYLFKSLLFFYSRRNRTGRVNCTLTERPLCLPGVHFSPILFISCTTRIASSPQPAPISRTTLGSAMLPSFSTTNCITTEPSTPFSRAIAGYLMFLYMNSNIFFCAHWYFSSLVPAMSSQPGNLGICSTTRKISSSFGLGGGGG